MSTVEGSDAFAKKIGSTEPYHRCLKKICDYWKIHQVFGPRTIRHHKEAGVTHAQIRA